MVGRAISSGNAPLLETAHCVSNVSVLAYGAHQFDLVSYNKGAQPQQFNTNTDHRLPTPVCVPRKRFLSKSIS